MSDSLAQVAELVRQETGVVIPDSQRPALAAALGRVAADMDAAGFLRELAEQITDGPLVGRLVDEVTVKETYFFRELAELRAVDWPRLVQTALASGAGTVRVWVSACATGDEAYTLAILASEALGTSRPPVTILATDVSAAAIERATAATYNERSLRNVPATLRERYFVKEDAGHYVVAPSLRSLVRFRRHNLLKDPVPPAGEVAFDVIACRNVLIYFEPQTVEDVIGSLETALTPTGQLILGAADRLSGTTVRLGRVSLDLPPVERRHQRAPTRHLRRPLGLDAQPTVTPRRRSEDRVEDALIAADAGDLDTALAVIGDVLAADPLDADAYFVRGLAELGLARPDAALTSFRRALYIDPSFGLAAFKLGRTHDARGEARAATRAYQQALRTLDPGDGRHRVILDAVDLGDIAAACRARLAA